MKTGFKNSVSKKQVPLAKWLGASYLRAAIIPFVLIELGFLIGYWATGNFTYERNVQTVTKVSRNYLADIANREAMTIQATLGSVEGLAKLYAMETRGALAKPYDPPASEKARYVLGDNGVFHTRTGGDETASFYSGIVPVGPAQVDKVWRTAQLDSTMRNIKASSPLIRQVYLNTWDSYNRIYPYIDAASQYAPKMNIPTYNFYYEADLRHNPDRKVVWTDAYVDPAGSGWMVSAIAPVYGPRRMEAVVGIDLTVETILQRILALDLPWKGYAMLVGRDGTILALPPAGEGDLGLKEMKDHHYDEAIRSDTFKPDHFNIMRRSELKRLAQAIASGKPQVTRIKLGGREMLAANAPVTGPGWNLVVVAPAKDILADATSLRASLRNVGLVMLAVLIVFYAGFFVFLTLRARVMSRRVAEPLGAIEVLMDRIGAGEYDQRAPRFGVTEIDNVSDRLVAMGGKLGEAYRQIVDQESTVRNLLENEKQVTSGQRRFINIMSHEFRTPLTVIDSCGQILRRRAARLTEETAIERSEMLRRAAARIDDVMKSALQLMHLEDGIIECRVEKVAVSGMVRDAMLVGSRARSDVEVIAPDVDEDACVSADPALIQSALSAVIDNACKYSPVGGRVTIECAAGHDGYRIVVRDQGIGILADDLPLVCERFFRGANSTAVPGAGTGLYVASTLVKAQGGELEILSTVDVGTQVIVTLPFAASDAANLPEAA